MHVELYERSTELKAGPEEVFRWHEQPEAFERLTPPWERVEVVHRTHAGLVDGSRVTLRVGRRPFRQIWVAEHSDVVPGRGFTDFMVTGPFACWRHEHRFAPDGTGGSRLTDRIEYALPLGALGRLFGGWFVRRKLERMFAYRHEVTARELGGVRREGDASDDEA
jgi:ligand-binding SRPBCC domain-containing protein